MLNIKIKRENDYRKNQYTILQFKGKFQSECVDQQKSLVPLGTLRDVNNQGKKYILEIGVMELVGKAVNLQKTFLVTETIQTGQNSRDIKIKGIVTKKILFQNRPAPNMERAVMQKKQCASKMFTKRQEKKQ